MPIRETCAFVLRHYDIGDNDRIVVFFSGETGKLKCVAKGARSRKSKYGASLETMCLVNLCYQEKENRELSYIRSCEPAGRAFSSNMSLSAGLYLSYMAELIDLFTQPGQQDSTLFRLIEKCARELAVTDKPSILILYFEIWLLKLEGVLPSFSRCGNCGNSITGKADFNLEKILSLCENCSGGKGTIGIGRDFQAVVNRIFKSPPDEFLFNTVPCKAVEDAIRVSRRITSGILGKKPNSLRVLEQINTGEA